jgi:hypothetical protein
MGTRALFVISRNIRTFFDRLWLIVPTLIVLQLGKDISASLHLAENKSKKSAIDKTD